MAHLAQVAQEKKGLGNTKSKSRNWVFTFNNYTEAELKSLAQDLGTSGKYIFQEEKGKEGTPHLQGYVEWKNARHFNALKKQFPKIHWEKCNNKKASIAYCCKDDTRIGRVYNKGIEPPEQLRLISEEKLYPWQHGLFEKIAERPDDRTIHWVQDTKGNNGKTAFCKMLCAKHGAIVLSGKQSDMFFGIVSYKEKTGNAPKVILIDIPRSMMNYVSYGGIEKIKDGLFFSAKYESTMFIMNSPHVICFANFECPKEEMSLDRWKVIDLDKKINPPLTPTD